MGVPNWYALRALSNRERAIERAAELAGIRTFLPLYREETRWSDRTKVVERLLFPGYLFVHVDPVLDLPYVLQFAGVLSVLPSNLSPTRITDSEIENLMNAVSSPSAFAPAVPVAGDKVTVKRGPLKGVSGVVVKSAKGVRLVVAVEMLQRAVAVEIDAADLAKESA